MIARAHIIYNICIFVKRAPRKKAAFTGAFCTRSRWVFGKRCFFVLVCLLFWKDTAEMCRSCKFCYFFKIFSLAHPGKRHFARVSEGGCAKTSRGACQGVPTVRKTKRGRDLPILFAERSPCGGAGPIRISGLRCRYAHWTTSTAHPLFRGFRL